MNPEQIAKAGTEHAHQAAFFCWCALTAHNGFENDKKPIPELKWIHAIPNGGVYGDNAKARQIRGAKMKAEGVKKGVSDVFLPVKRGYWSGLYIEFKKPGQLSHTSKEQREFGAFVKGQGFGFIVVDNWRDAADIVTEYLKQ